jgi:hypothetical protein
MLQLDERLELLTLILSDAWGICGTDLERAA